VFAGTDTGVYRSGDRGGSWAAVGGGLPVSPTHALLYDASAHVLHAGTSDGAFESADSGISWSLSAPGLSDPRVLSLALPDGNLFAGTQGSSVFRRVAAAAGREPVSLASAPPAPRLVPPR